jgi:hypothetical protein
MAVVLNSSWLVPFWIWCFGLLLLTGYNISASRWEDGRTILVLWLMWLLVAGVAIALWFIAQGH